MMNYVRNLPLTMKLATIIVAINLIGIVGLAFYTWSSESKFMVELAEKGWLQNADQFGSIAAGGVKWGKVDAIREAYALHRDDPKLNLEQFYAFNAKGEMVDSWTREGLSDLPPLDSLKSLAGTEPAEAKVSEANLSDGYVDIVSPLPVSKNGAQSGFLITTWSAKAQLASAKHKALITLGAQLAVITASILAFLMAMRHFVGHPLKTLSNRISALHQGDFETPVVYQQNGDEIGFLARALEVFRNEAISKQEQSKRSEEQRLALDEERQRSGEQAQSAAKVQSEVMAALASSLERLAKGDFTAYIKGLPPEFAKLSGDFNAMVDAVAEAITEIKQVSISVQSGSGELASSADQLAKRTEQQAAALEQTAAAINEVTGTVANSSSNAQNASQLVGETKQGAESSAQIVREAIGAMDRIQQSSAKIGTIISVIDEIAFQTNLLALNAGVEAARAGEAGKGFAVVAQEVRELAQRSANAAKEIKTLISASGAEVSTGVNLVNSAGDALLTIGDQVSKINESILQIVASYQEQSSGLKEINTAINQMDQATQQNAAMVEETNAACHDLLSQSKQLQSASGRFNVKGTGLSNAASTTPQAAVSAKPPAGRAAAHAAPVARGNTALAQNTWEEF
ncbi:methyl-accepting chemotaxis protein [Agrobacterium sp. ES01]|uniref:methyl-accepting chemotaxis protein n=1 Tax=Agrobacterium sp. ES01 TaxID=3420714 RepID=UPI003D0D86CB